MKEITYQIIDRLGFLKEVHPVAFLFIVAWLAVLVYFIFTRIEEEDIRKAFLHVMLSFFLWGILLFLSSIWTTLLYPAVILLLGVIFYIIWQHRQLIQDLSPGTITFYICSYVLLLVIMFWSLYLFIGHKT
jgi:hypothetical protein